MAANEDTAKNSPSRKTLSIAARLEEVETRPHRGILLHWVAFVLSLQLLRSKIPVKYMQWGGCELDELHAEQVEMQIPLRSKTH